MLAKGSRKILENLVEISCDNHTKGESINALKNVKICLNTNIYSYLETSGGQISKLSLNVVHFFNLSVN
jgi:hypothetical protein